MPKGFKLTQREGSQAFLFTLVPICASPFSRSSDNCLAELWMLPNRVTLVGVACLLLPSGSRIIFTCWVDRSNRRWPLHRLRFLMTHVDGALRAATDLFSKED